MFKINIYTYKILLVPFFLFWNNNNNICFELQRYKKTMMCENIEYNINIKKYFFCKIHYKILLLCAKF